MAALDELLRRALLVTVILGLIGACDDTGTPAGRNSAGAERHERPNVVLVITDDQGAGDLSFNDNPIVKTPALRQLASESVHLTNFHVDPTCSPTRAALLTGQHSLRAGVWHTVMGRALLASSRTTIAEVLAEAGYATGIFGKWHLGDNYPFRPQDQGFQRTVVHGGGGVGQTPDVWGNTQFDDSYYVDGRVRKFSGNSTDIWFDEAERFIRSSVDEPFFAYIATNAPHRPWRAPEGYIEPYRQAGLPEPMATFYGMISHVDARVGRLRLLLEELDLDENTIFIFTTDNGSSFSESELFYEDTPSKVIAHLEAEFPGWRPNAGRRGYKGEVYEGGHRTPLLIHWPGGGLDTAREVSALTAHFDLLPTLLELLGLDAPGDLDGRSFAPLLFESSPNLSRAFADRSVVVTHQRVFVPRISRPAVVMRGPWRLVVHDEAGLQELYNVDRDPAQTADVSDQHPKIVQELRHDLDTWWRNATQDGFEPTYIPVGSRNENPARLTAMDWMEAPSTEAIPWFPGFGVTEKSLPFERWIGREEEFTSLPWYIDAQAAGGYRITLALHDLAANRTIDREAAVLELDGKTHSVPIPDGADRVAFEVDLATGRHRLRGWFQSLDGASKPLPAIYAYVEKLE